MTRWQSSLSLYSSTWWRPAHPVPASMWSPQFIWQMGGGALLGVAGGFSLVFLINRLTLSAGLYPLLALSGGAVIFGLTQMIGASGFLAAYLAGLVVGNRRIQALHNIQRFYDGVAWLAQIGLFLILGLLATPSELVATALPALLIAAVLIFVARPLAVVVSLAPFRFTGREQAFISWVGLRGAVPIVLAMFPLLAGLENAQLFFNVAFFIVLVSLVLQGWSVAMAARLTRVELPSGSSRVQRVELELPGQLDYELVGYRITADSPASGRAADDLEFDLDARVTLVVRDGRLFEASEAGTLQHGDYVYLLVRQLDVSVLDPYFVARVAPEQVRTRSFFGEFVLEPSVTLGMLCESYGVTIDGTDPGQSLDDFLHDRFKKPVVGDRVRLETVEIVVREMADDKITRIGLKLGG
jgi:potassium/hydrogen antiporter